jgi:hypothetical protein
MNNRELVQAFRRAAMQEIKLMQFASHIAGKRADVRILASRVQWTVRGRQHVIDVIPIGAIESVAAKRARPGKSMLTISSQASAIQFRVKRAVAEQAAAMLTDLVSQQVIPPLDGSQTVQAGSIADELMSLRWLRDVGVLTAAEFDEQSTRLLGLC